MYRARVPLWLPPVQRSPSRTRDTRALLTDEVRKRIGAKGTDLYVESPRPGGGGTVPVSLVEAQVLQALHDANERRFAELVLHDIVSSETQASMQAVWNKASLPDPVAPPPREGDAWIRLAVRTHPRAFPDASTAPGFARRRGTAGARLRAALRRAAPSWWGAPRRSCS